jgi:integrase
MPESERPRCLVYLLDQYLKVLPNFAFEKDIFYCRPKKQCPSTLTTPWYDSAPVGKNKLGSMVSDICNAAGIPRRTNHSLHATRATALFQSNLPEKLIQKTTGHRYLDSLRMYEHSSTEQFQSVSKVMMSNEFEKAKEVVKDIPDFRGILENVTNCSIGKIVVNMLPASATDAKKTIDWGQNRLN